MRDSDEKKRKVALVCLKTILESESFNDSVESEYEASELPKIKVVSLSVDWKLRVLVYGQCPCCKAKHMRNICNVRFVKHCVLPKLMNKVKLLNEVTCVLTHDSDFEEVVRSLGGKVETMVEEDEVKTFFEHECFLLRQHPDIDGYSKFMTLRSENIPNVDSKLDLIRFGDVVGNYYCSWSISDGNGVLLTDDGDVLVENEIMKEHNRWMSKFKLGKILKWNDIALSLLDKNSIRNTDYKQVVFE